MERLFRIPNLGLATWLTFSCHSYGAELNPRDTSEVVFVFRRDDEGVLDGHVADYHTNSAAVDAREFKRVEAELKRKMFAVLDAARGGEQR